MNVQIDHIKVLVKESFLYNGDLTKTDLIPAEIVGISSYKNQAITFHVLINGQYLYSDLPITSFCSKQTTAMDLSDLCYSNCESLPIDVFKLNFNTVEVKFKNQNIFICGEYILSIDFYEGNDLLHLILLNNGNFCLMPNHKVNFGNKQQLSDYKKNKQTWIIN